MNTTAQPNAIADRIMAANRRAEDLTRRRAAVEARLDEARKTYQRLAAAVKEKYGTSNPDELQAEIDKRERENLARIDQFETDLSKVEAVILEAERALAG
jgi:hypothetical protein